MNRQSAVTHPAVTHSARSGPRGFTLVELLVVIAIIGVLASLALVGVQAALRKADQTAIKVELDGLHGALEEYKNQHDSYPPNCLLTSGGEESNVTALVASDLRRHFKKAFPKHREPDIVFSLLTGQTGPLAGMQGGGIGMRADEAVVFWLSLSSDPKYPISGPQGPSFLDNNSDFDDLENRNFIYDFSVKDLGPRDTDGRFDTVNGRQIEYTSPIPADGGSNRIINLWVYTPAGRRSPVAYFDTSRHPPAEYDPGSGILGADSNLLIFAIKKIDPLARDAGAARAVKFATPNGFQILHAGLDDEWGEAFERTAYRSISNDEGLAYPDGPFTLEMADTQVNFSTQTLEESEE